MHHSILDRPYTLNQSQIDFYKKNAFIKLKEVLDGDTTAFYNRVISAKVDELNQQSIPLEKRDTYGKAFLQLFNLWREDPEIQTLIFSKRFGAIGCRFDGS
jgi:hypothetical protein